MICSFIDIKLDNIMVPVFCKKLFFFQRQLVQHHVGRPSGPSPGSMIPEEDSWDLHPSSSQLWFIPAKGHQTQLAKGRGSWISSRENQNKLPSVLSQWSHRGHLHPPSNAFYMWEHMWHVTHQGSSLETYCPSFWLGAGHVGSLCLAHTQIPDSQMESRSWA